jgi:hypothetical protein
MMVRVVRIAVQLLLLLLLHLLRQQLPLQQLQLLLTILYPVRVFR